MYRSAGFADIQIGISALIVHGVHRDRDHILRAAGDHIQLHRAAGSQRLAVLHCSLHLKKPGLGGDHTGQLCDGRLIGRPLLLQTDLIAYLQAVPDPLRNGKGDLAQPLSRDHTEHRALGYGAVQVHAHTF